MVHVVMVLMWHYGRLPQVVVKNCSKFISNSESRDSIVSPQLGLPIVLKMFSTVTTTTTKDGA